MPTLAPAPLRVALTKGSLFIPPTYFALEHATSMSDIDWRAFTLLARINDSRVRIPVEAPLSPSLPATVGRVAKWGMMGAMVRRIEEWGPDIIHQQQATWSLPALEAARRLNAPLVVTVHGGDAYPGGGCGGAWNSHNRRASFDKSSLILAVSKYLAGVAISSGAPKERVRLHYQGVDTRWWTPSDCDHERGEDERPIVLFVGSLSPHKGVPDLLEASARLVSHTPHRLVLVGDGPLARSVRHNAPEHVLFTGPLPRTRVREWMRRAHVLTLPSLPFQGREEAAGLVLLEAQACQVPALAYPTGGIPEMVDPASGILTPSPTPEALATHLGEVLTWGEEERAERGRSARTWVDTHRSTALAIAELRDFYASL